MNLELDHVFILTKPKAKVADLLLELGFEESFSRDHLGQGTSNRRFVFSNGMLEFLWVRDEAEANNGPAKNLNFPARSKPNATPFGIVLTRKDNDSLTMPFSGWAYEPDYFKPPHTPKQLAFHIGENSTDLNEPLCIYVPFIEPKQRTIEKGTFKSISHVKVFTKNTEISTTLKVVDNADRLSIASGTEDLMEITFDDHKQNNSHDFRPHIPLVIHW